MRTFCITLPEYSRHELLARRHFEAMKLNVDFIWGISGEHFGLYTNHTYEVDNPGSGHTKSPAEIGCFLSHYMVWSICKQLPDDYFLILEDDVRFACNAKARIAKALTTCPSDWDILYIGSCNCSGKVTTKVTDELYVVSEPHCTHAYMVRKKALSVLLSTQRDVYAPIDISMAFHALPLLKTYVLLPRAAEQLNHPLNP